MNTFIGRTSELKQLLDATKQRSAQLIVIYGRRRTGKTTLIQHAFSDRQLIQFEGIQGQSEEYQRAEFMATLRKYFANPLLAQLNPKNWKEVFEALATQVTEGSWTIHLEELQWMANYREQLISELKPVWDNQLSKNNQLILVLCGSSASFFSTKVLRSRALYNRSHVEIQLAPFSLAETREFLPKLGQRALLDAYLSVGGIPPYLERLHDSTSIYQTLCEKSFKKDSYFFSEYERVFVSSFAEHSAYKATLEYLSAKKVATRSEIITSIGAKSGAFATKLLNDLKASGFISEVHPLKSNRVGRVKNFTIKDNYLHYYHRWIRPIQNRIRNGAFDANATSAMELDHFSQWLGYAFERYCREHAHHIAQILGFSGISYRSGPLVSVENNDRAQVDLAFFRRDKTVTVCEIKYTSLPAERDIIAEFERKLKIIRPLITPQSATIQRVLISAAGASSSLIEQNYFHRVLTIDDILPQ